MAGDRGERRARQVTIGAIVVGGLWRLGLVASRWSTPLKFNDSVYYSEQAKQLVHGTFFRAILFENGPAAEHPPLTSIVLAPVSWGADPVHWQRLVTAVCGIVTIWVLAELATRLAGVWAGATAAVIAAVYPNLWLNDGLVMSESVSVLCVAASLLVLLAVLDEPTWRRLVGLGILLGLGALARSELALLFILAVVLVAWRQRDRAGLRRAAAIAGVGILVIAPWVVFNLVRFDRTVLLTTNDGTTLLGANCPESWYGPGTGGWTARCLPADGGDTLAGDQSVRADKRRELGLQYVRDHPGRAPVVVLARVGRTLDLHGLGNQVQADVDDERPRWGSWAGIVAFWVLLPLAVYGVARAEPPGRTVLLLPCVCVLVATVGFYGAHRIRSSLEPVVVVGAALAIEELAGRRLRTGS
jgi:4-amino-4-deoxy-L-arabinose transferase-like glycosyltransferase